MSLVILGTGNDLPVHVITNDDIEQQVVDYDRERARGSLHDWSMARPGVTSRHAVAPGEGTSEMALRAARRAIESAGIEPEEVELIVLGTMTSDHRLPHTVNFVQRDLGITAKCIQLETACAGFIDVVAVAAGLMATAGYKTVLAGHAEAVSAIVDPKRFMIRTIFGDGAGFVVLRQEPGSPYGLRSWVSYTDSSVAHWVTAGGGIKSPPTPANRADGSWYLTIQPDKVFPFAVEKMVEATYEVLARAERTIDDIDWLVPHHAGANIVAAVAERLKIPADRVLTTIDHTGNTSGAAIPIALDEFSRAGRFRPGDCIVMPSVGGGMTWGALLAVWGS